VPRTSRGREFRAVLVVCQCGSQERGDSVGDGPSVCDYNVVEWCVPLAEARETDLDHHGLLYSF